MEGWNRANQGWQAVLDLGTNTFQLAIGRQNGRGLEFRLRKKLGVGMGKGGIENGTILPAVFEKCLEALLTFRKDILEASLLPENTKVIGTSAFRSLKEPHKWLAQIQAQTGFEVEIISGIEESELIFAGIQASGVLKTGINQLVVDIGGGSVEFIHCQGDEVIWKQSFEIGGIRLREKFHHHEPILQTEIDSLEIYLTEELVTLWQYFENQPPPILIGCSGSFDTFIDMLFYSQPQFQAENFPFHELPISLFESLANRLLKADLEQRLAMKGMIPLRAEMIVVAVVLVQLILRRLNCPSIFTSTFSLKEGWLWSTLMDEKSSYS